MPRGSRLIHTKLNSPDPSLMKRMLVRLHRQGHDIVIFRVLLAVAICAITWLALTPKPSADLSLGWDKANHLVAFFVLAFLSEYSFQPVTLQRRIVIGLSLATYGLAIELFQSQTQARFFEVADLLADLIGVFAYMIVAEPIKKYTLLRAVSGLDDTVGRFND